MKRISILGATGSVGRSTVDLIARAPETFAVEALTANRDAARLAGQAKALKAKFAAVADPSAYPDLKAALAGTGIEAAAGPDAVIEAAIRPSDWVMAAIVGAAGLAPTLAAIRQGKTIGLANKETLVCAGALVTAEVAKSGATLIPVDSEHSAIFQVFEPARVARVARLILTASGGPFRNWPLAKMRDVTPAQAVAHPNWSMGAKISVDSATMMNKGLELIEACWLFGMPVGRVEVLIHPQSVIHSLVEYVDGSLLAQLGSPDMRVPIACAMDWPARIDSGAAVLDLVAVGRLAFEAPDLRRFPCLALAMEAAHTGASAPIALNAANEIAVEAFLAGRIGYTAIPGLIGRVLDAHSCREPRSLDDVKALDAEARARARALLSGGGA